MKEENSKLVVTIIVLASLLLSVYLSAQLLQLSIIGSRGRLTF